VLILSTQRMIRMHDSTRKTCGQSACDTRDDACDARINN
jgi:hypothetical protein